MTIAGTVADAQKVVDILTANAQLYQINMNSPMPVSSAARLVANLLFSARYMPLATQVLVGGVDDTGPHVYNLDPYGSLTEEKSVSTGSGSPIAYGILEDKYREGMTIAELLPIIVKAVNAAMKRDVASGNNYNIIVIDENGYRELSDEEKSRSSQGRKLNLWRELKKKTRQNRDQPVHFGESSKRSRSHQNRV